MKIGFLLTSLATPPNKTQRRRQRFPYKPKGGKDEGENQSMETREKVSHL